MIRLGTPGRVFAIALVSSFVSGCADSAPTSTTPPAPAAPTEMRAEVRPTIPDVPAPDPGPTTPPTTVPPTGTGPSSAFVNNPARCATMQDEARRNPARFSPTTPFNIPAACLELHPESANWASTWYEHGNLPGRTDPRQRGDLRIAFDAYSTAVYYADQATTTINVYTAGWSYGYDLENGRSIPWNPSWRPASGTDGEMIILDRTTGKEIELWGVQTSNFSECLTLGNILAGFRPGTDLCTYTAYVGRNQDGTIANGTTSSGFSKLPTKGMGHLLGMALLPTLDEIENGSINHAVNMETYATMFGPGCTASQISAGVAGTDCGFSVAPATRLEWSNAAPVCGASSMSFTSTDRAKTVPEGMRFVLNKTDAEIEAWLNSQNYTGARRSTARIFAVALRDYGWIISDTTCWTSSMPVEGVANPDARARWRALGVGDPTNDSRLLNGLIGSSADVKVIRPSADRLLTSASGSAS